MLANNLWCDVILDYLNAFSDEEALAVLSAIGFRFADWPTINRLGGAKEVLGLASVRKLIAEKAGFLQPRLKHARRGFDQFYQAGGFLLSPASNVATRLFRSNKAPLIFFARGCSSILSETPMVSIVGSRQASRPGLLNTKCLSEILVQNQITVVSGGALGVDQMAHDAVLARGGKTVIISGTACDWPVDRWQDLAVQYPSQVVIIYPFGPFLAQGKFMFIERNRYVAALADALVIVEGKMGSGTLYTAQFAKDLNVLLYAMPGQLGDPLAFVPNKLLEEGRARALVNFEQFASSLVTKSAKPLKKRLSLNNNRATNVEKHAELPYLLRVISERKNSLGFDELLAITGKSFADLQRELLEYELKGLIAKRGAVFMLTGN